MSRRPWLTSYQNGPSKTLPQGSAHRRATVRLARGHHPAAPGASSTTAREAK